MQPILNYTPQVYEAIIAAFIVIGLIQTFALRHKWHQAEKLKKDIKQVIVQATGALLASAMSTSLRVAKAKNETRKIAEAADEALATSSALIDALNEQVEELREGREDDQESRIDDLETAVGELVAEHNSSVVEEDRIAEEDRVSDIGRFPFGSPGPFAGAGGDPLSALFASLARNGLSPTGRNVGRDGPTIKAFKLTPRGLEPVNGPADFGLPEVSTFNRPTPGGDSVPSIADILSLLASLPTPRRRTSVFPPDFGVPESLLKADLSSGPAAPGDDPYAAAADAIRANAAEGTSNATGTATEPQTASPVAGGAEPPANEPGARAVPRSVPRHDPLDYPYQSPRAG